MCKKLFGVVLVAFVLSASGAALASAPQGQSVPAHHGDGDQGPPNGGGTDYDAPPPAQPNHPPAQHHRPRVKRRKVNYAHHFRPIASVSGVFFGNGEALPVTQSFGVVAGLKFLQPLELEVGASFFDFSYSVFTNAGASWAIGKWRNIRGAGLELRGGVLAGYRFLRKDDEFGVDDFHGVTTSAAIEFNIWLSRRFGIHFHFAGGLGFWVARTDKSMPVAFPEFRSAVGIIF